MAGRDARDGPAAGDREMAGLPPIRVLLVDAQAPNRERLAALLAHDPALTIVGAAADGPAALAAVPRRAPHVVILDLHLPDARGVETIRHLRTAYPSVYVLALTAIPDDAEILDALRAGASGCLPIDLPGASLVAAVKQAAHGAPVLDSAVARQLAPRPPTGPLVLPALSPREREVLALIGDGRSNREIAFALALGEGTVKTHVHNVLQKLGLPDRAALARYAAQGH